MPDSDRSDPDAPFGSGARLPNHPELDAAIAGLDRATRLLGQRFDDIGGGSDPGADPEGRYEPRPLGSAAAAHPASERTRRAEPEAGLGDEMRRADREAREYLNRAKQRADSLVNAMIGAVEREAAEIRRGAEEGIRERWRTVEVEAGRYLEDARRVADGMVSERQARLSGLSEGIATRAEELTAGMEDADRVRRQFEDFVRALSRTADQIARAWPEAEAGISPVGERGQASSRGAVAA